jgi:uncharacterized membrane protein HdeD (DUF308 family)
MLFPPPPIVLHREKIEGVHLMVSATDSLSTTDLGPGLRVFRRHRVWVSVLGVVLIILGIAALAAAALTTLISVLFLGWLLVIGGLVQVVHAFWARPWGGVFAHLVAGALSLVVGLLFLTRPTLAELALTLLVAVLLVVGGLFRVNIALLWRFPAWGWVVYDGVLSLVLGFVIWIAWPQSALWVIGMLVGIDLLFKGWSCLMFALAARPPHPTLSPSGWGRG